LFHVRIFASLRCGVDPQDTRRSPPTQPRGLVVHRVDDPQGLQRGGRVDPETLARADVPVEVLDQQAMRGAQYARSPAATLAGRTTSTRPSS
jgi:hypothetical protein